MRPSRADRRITRSLTTLPERLEHVLRQQGDGSVAAAGLALFPHDSESVATRRVRRWIAPEGRRYTPSLDAIITIAVRFDIDLNWLLLGRP